MTNIALVTGGSRGIGRATVLRLLDEGWSVAFTWRDSENAAEDLLAAMEGEIRDRVAAFRADVRDHARTDALLGEVVSRFGRIDAVVNNAGIRNDALAVNMTDEQWQEVLDTNLTGAFRLSRAALGMMLRQRRGAIVNVASLSGLHGVTGQANYGAAKAGLISLTKTLAREAARSGIRINCVAPGLVETEMIAGLPDEVRREMVRAIPMRRILRPEEVATAISFLLSDAASGITGQVLCVDGGASA